MKQFYFKNRDLIIRSILLAGVAAALWAAYYIGYVNQLKR